MQPEPRPDRAPQGREWTDARASSVPPSHARSLFVTAPVTCAIIVINVVVFAAELLAAGDLGALVQMPGEVVRSFGGNLASATIWQRELETLVTSCFLHFSALHLGFNMLALKQAGPIVERSAGAGRFTPMYVASGAAGSLLSAVVGVVSHDPRLSAGASGAICGVIGAALVIGVRTEGWKGPLTRSMAQWLLMIFAVGYAMKSRVDPYAHAGGAVAGAVIAAAWRRNVVYGAVGRWLGILASTAVCVACAARVAGRDTSDPYSLLSADERFDQANAALSAGDCLEARRALDAAAKLAPTAQRIIDLRRSIDAHCEE